MFLKINANMEKYTIQEIYNRTNENELVRKIHYRVHYTQNIRLRIFNNHANKTQKMVKKYWIFVATGFLFIQVRTDTHSRPQFKTMTRIDTGKVRQNQAVIFGKTRGRRTA